MFLNTLSLILVVIGAINWGIYGLFKWDLVGLIFGGGDMLAMLPRIIYVLVGLAGVYMLFTIGSWLKK
jgi:uncharacterized protein